MIGNQAHNSTDNQFVTDCGREPNPPYGIADRVGLAHFPILEGRPDPEAGS
jgi:hypothetical protein